MHHIRLSLRAAALILLVAATPAAAASFPVVVRAILNAQSDGRIANMGPDQKARMIECVISALSGVPNGQKRLVAEGATLDEQTDRFGDLVNADRAKWKQAIAKACASIAMGGSSND